MPDFIEERIQSLPPSSVNNSRQIMRDEARFLLNQWDKGKKGWVSDALDRKFGRDGDFSEWDWADGDLM